MDYSDPVQLTDFLCEIRGFQSVPRKQLEWLVRESTLVTYEQGPFLKPGDRYDYLVVILEGEMNFYSLQNNQRKVLGTWSTGSFDGGILPFSRGVNSPAYADITKRLTGLILHRSRFPEMICSNYELGEVLVHAMLDRVRMFTTMHFQNEKLMALGKLSAGLAHELNNPAAAILRNAEELTRSIAAQPESVQTLVSLKVDPSDITHIASLFSIAGTASTASLSSLERMQREDEILEWLEKHDLQDDCASSLLEAGLTVTELERLRQQVEPPSFSALLQWVSRELQSQRTAQEIAVASKRISELVQSVKNYTRMDQVHDVQEVAIHAGIRNTLTILQHKIQRNGVIVTEQLADNMPLIPGFPGELTQVWTNIIDNALDVMKEGGELIVQTEFDDDSVIFRVIDTGPGIPPEHLERIFDPFFTTKDVGEGTGVGLDVVQKVVQLHHGAVAVDSKPGRTEFRVTFPRTLR